MATYQEYMQAAREALKRGDQEAARRMAAAAERAAAEARNTPMPTVSEAIANMKAAPDRPASGMFSMRQPPQGELTAEDLGSVTSGLYDAAAETAGLPVDLATSALNFALPALGPSEIGPDGDLQPAWGPITDPFLGSDYWKDTLSTLSRAGADLGEVFTDGELPYYTPEATPGDDNLRQFVNWTAQGVAGPSGIRSVVQDAAEWAGRTIPRYIDDALRIVPEGVRGPRAAGIIAARTGGEAAAAGGAMLGQDMGADIGGDLAALLAGEEARPVGETIGSVGGTLLGGLTPDAARAGGTDLLAGILRREESPLQPAGGVADMVQQGNNLLRTTLDPSATPLPLPSTRFEGLPPNIQLPSSAETLAALTRMGVKPSIGLLGNRTARYLENFASLYPFIGSIPVNRQQRLQADQISDFAGDTIRMRAEGPGATPAPPLSQSPIETAQFVRDAARRQQASLSADIHRREGAISAAVGENSLVPIAPALAQFDATMGPRDPLTNAPLVPERQALLQMARPIDTQLNGLLMADLNTLRQLEAARDRATTTAERRYADNALARAEQTIGTSAQIEQRILDNMGVPYSQLRDYRKNIGARSAAAGLPGAVQGEIRAGVDAALTPWLGSQVGTQWDELLETERNLLNSRTQTTAEGGDIPNLQKFSAMDSGQLANVLSGTLTGDTDTLELLARSMSPEDFRRMSADLLLQMGQPTSATTLASEVGTATFTPARFLSNWLKMPERARILLAGDDQIRRRLDDIATGSLAMIQRGRAANPSGTTVAALFTGMLSPTALGTVAAGAAAQVPMAISETLARIVGGYQPGAQERYGLRVLPTIMRTESASEQPVQ